MLKELIGTQISTKELTFEPGGTPVSFDVTVVNHSEQFATFQVELLAAGAKAGANNNWYRISPEVCTKKPPGDLTKFSIQVTDTPKPGFVGLMTLTVRVYSVELREADSRQIVRLIVPGSGVAAPQVDLPTQEFLGYPGDRVKISVSLESFNQRPSKVTLRLLGIDSSWFPEGTERRLLLTPTQNLKEVFECHIPDTGEAVSQIYPFIIEVSQLDAPTVQVVGTLKVLPQGFVEFKCNNLVKTLPEKHGWFASPKANTAQYTLEFDNQSNLIQEVGVELSYGSASWMRALQLPLWQRLRRRKNNEEQDLLPSSLEIVPEKAELSLTAPTEFSLTVRQPRPWLGWTRKRFLQAKAITPDRRIEVHNDTQTLEVQILPVVPFWLQVGILFFGLPLILSVVGWSFWGARLLLEKHIQPVNTVRFNGLATEVVSGSNDQTIRRWIVQDNTIRPRQLLVKADKAVRVVRYRPLNNDRLAVGFENGEIQLFNMLSGESSLPFGSKDTKDDRVFDLVFAKDSRSLFSAHGSGMVWHWNIEDGIPLNQKILGEQQVGFAVRALALVGQNQSHLAIAGRFNQLSLWDLKNNKLRQVTSASGSQEDYIFSLATAENQPNLLVTSDNQGNIKILNLRSCLAGTGECEIVDEWKPDKQAVRAVALSADGCYLASAGDDGKARLWALNAKGQRTQNQDITAGKVLQQLSQPLNTVDIIRIQDEVLVASGGDDRGVRVQHLQQKRWDCH
jgi:WD40 repeat protein